MELYELRWYEEQVRPIYGLITLEEGLRTDRDRELERYATTDPYGIGHIG